MVLIFEGLDFRRISDEIVRYLTGRFFLTGYEVKGIVLFRFRQVSSRKFLNVLSLALFLTFFTFHIASCNPRNFDGELSTSSIRSCLVRFPKTSRTRDCSSAMLRRSSSWKVRRHIVHADEASRKTSKSWVHESLGASEFGWWGAAVHGPRDLRIDSGHGLLEAELFVAYLRILFWAVVKFVWPLPMTLSNVSKSYTHSKSDEKIESDIHGWVSMAVK